MALPFLSLTIELKNAVCLLCLPGTTMSFYIVIRSLQDINWRKFAFIALCAGSGLPVGLCLFAYLPALQLCILLGLFMAADQK